MEPFPHLRQPIRLGLLTIPNRIMLTTHGPRLSQPRYLRYIAERAKGGVGLITVEVCTVDVKEKYQPQ